MPNYTRNQQKELTLPPRLPLIGVPNQRGQSAEQDSRLVNGYAEFGQDEVVRIVKRPGVSVKFTLAGEAAGVFGDYSVFYELGGGTYTASLYLNSTLLDTFASYLDIGGETRFFTFGLPPVSAEETVLFMNNRYDAFIWDGAVAGALKYAGDAIGTLSCATTSGSAIVTTASTVALMKYALVTGAGIPADTYIESVDSATQITLSANATATSGAVNLTFEAAGPPQRDGVVSLTPLRQLVDGVPVLNLAVYLFTQRRIIAGADRVDPRAWNPLNQIVAYAESDSAVAIDHQLGYLVAFKGVTTEFFRDEGLSPGSPLARVEGLQLNVGCYEGRTVQSIDGVLLWCSYTESALKSVYALEGLKANEIATPAVKRVLAGLNPAYAISFSWDGHSFYVLTDPAAGVSLVFDLTSKFWSYWNALGETYFPFRAATVNGSGETILQHEDNGKLYKLDETVHEDEGQPIVMDIYTPQFDGNVRLTKMLPRVHVVADQESGSILQVRHNDSDLHPDRWTNWREFDLGADRPSLANCGSFYKRYYHFRHASPTPCRLISVELELLPGTL